MSRTINSPVHDALVAYLRNARKAAGMTQLDVARLLDRHQSFVATVEAGQRRIDVVELIAFANAIGFDASNAVRLLQDI